MTLPAKVLLPGAPDADGFIGDLRGRLERRLAEVEEQLAAAAVELRDGYARERRRLRAALDRICEDRYGVCCACEEPLSVEHLRTDPAAPFCTPCEAEIKESRRGR